MSIRPALIAAALAALALAACHRGGDADESTPQAQPNTAVEASPQAPPPEAAPPAAPKPPTLTAAERRRKLREEKDGEAQAERAPEYEGAHGAATALPSQGDDTPAASSDAPALGASPPPSPPGQPPG